jgi:hypothetical protein
MGLRSGRSIFGGEPGIVIGYGMESVGMMCM